MYAGACGRNARRSGNGTTGRPVIRDFRSPANPHPENVLSAVNIKNGRGGTATAVVIAGR